MKINKNFEIAQKHKIWFVISLSIITLGIIVFTIFAAIGGLSKGLNLGIDFTGGTQLDVEIGSFMNDDNKEEIKKVITDTLNEFGIKDRAAIQLTENGYTVSYRTDSKNNDLVLNGGENSQSLKSRLVETINAENSDEVIQVKVQSIAAKAGSSADFYVLLFVLAAWVLIAAYMIFRFELSSAIAAFAGLVHDILIVFAFAAIFRIQINIAFFGALIAVVCYSIYNTIIVFDKARENARRESMKESTAAEIINKSTVETFKRIIYTTAIISILLVSLIITGVSYIIWPALFAVLGLITATYSSLFIVPSVWALYKSRQQAKSGKSEYFKKKVLFKRTEKTEPSVMENQRDE